MVAGAIGLQPGSDGAAPLIVAVAIILGFELFHRLYAGALLDRIQRVRNGELPVPKRLAWWSVPIVQLAGFAAILYAGWGPWILDRWTWISTSTTATGAALLLPWLVLHASWLLQRRRVAVVLRERDWPRLPYVAFHLRVLIIPALPVVIATLVQDLVRLSPRTAMLFDAHPSLSAAVSVFAIAAMFILSPWIVRLAFATATLPDGPLRRRFEDVARRGRFRYLDLRVCRTHGHVINAAFVGVLGRLRYVIFTDGIFRMLDEDELVGVFAHEMGHSQRRHTLLNLVMLLGFSALLNAVVLQLEGIGLSETLLLALSAGAVPLFFLFVFAPIARRFETEADVFAGEVLGDPSAIIGSLARLGTMFPDKRSNGGFIHPSIDSRIGFLERYFADPAAARRFRGRMRRLKLGIVVAAVAPLVLWGFALKTEADRGSFRLAVYDVLEADDEAAARVLLAEIDAAVDRGHVDRGFENRMWLWQTIATARQDVGDYDAAEPFVELMLAHREQFVRLEQPYNAAIIAAQQAAATGRFDELDAHLSEAELRIEPLVRALGRNDPQIEDEKGGIALLRAGLQIHAARTGLEPPRLPPSPASRALIDLWRARVEGRPAPASSLDATDLSEEREAWRVDFVRAVARSLGS